MYLTRKTDLIKAPERARGKRLLHFAPEASFYRHFASNSKVEYFPVDLFPEEFEASGMTVARADITAIPFPDNSFDVILCSHVLEHIPDDRLAMSELYRVLAPGGWGIFQVPIDYSRAMTYEDPSIVDPADRTLYFGQSDHVRWYGRDYPDRLRSVGFTVQEDDYIHTLPPATVAKYRLNRSELVYLGAKPKEGD
jgi:SAM-dependent methyltransferase